jgi:hypothetical protein
LSTASLVQVTAQFVVVYEESQRTCTAYSIRTSENVSQWKIPEEFKALNVVSMTCHQEHIYVDSNILKLF